MGSTALVVSKGTSAISVGTTYFPVGNCSCGDGVGVTGNTDEAAVQIPFYTAGTISGMTVTLGEKIDTGFNTTFTLRKNGVDTSVVVRFSGSTTEYGVDSRNSTTIVSGDKLSVKMVCSAQSNTGSSSLTAISFLFTPTSGIVTLTKAAHAHVRTTSSANTTYYEPIFGIGGTAAFGNTTELNAQLRMPVAATIRNLSVYCSANARPSSDVTVTLRLNGADTALTVSLPTGAALTEDTINSISVDAGDLVNLEVSTGASTSEITVNFMAIEIITTDHTFLLVGAGSSASPSIGFDTSISNRNPLGGSGVGASGASEPGTPATIILKDLQIWQLFLRVRANTAGATSYVYGVYDGTSAFSQPQITVGPGETGWFTANANTLTDGNRGLLSDQLSWWVDNGGGEGLGSIRVPIIGVACRINRLLGARQR